MQVLSPKQVQDISGLEGKLAEWEEKMKAMERDYPTEKISDGMKRAIMTAMCPNDIQEIIILKAESWANYTEMKEYITSWVSNKMVLRSTAVPMQIGNVQAENCQNYYDEAEDIGAVRENTQCYNCGGWGHVARQCPGGKAKGKGKPTSVYPGSGPKGGGAKGGGKDGGAGKNGWWNPKGKGKGKGRGGQVQCWKCWKFGHRQAECVAMVDDAQEKQETVDAEVDSVWQINQVDVKDLKHAEHTFPRTNMKVVEFEPPVTKTFNRFAALSPHDADDSCTECEPILGSSLVSCCDRDAKGSCTGCEPC